MIVNKINQYENRFIRNNNLKPFKSVTINGYKIEGYKVIKKYDTFFYKNKTNKKKICIHFTAGNLNSDINQLTKENFHVSVPYVIGVNGVIYKLFEDNKWSYHLGRGASGGNKKMSMETIGIELSNYGILKKRGEYLYTIYNNIFCKINDTDKYYYSKNGYRGYNYFAAYSDAQIDSLIVLLRYLMDKYNIPLNILKEGLYNKNMSTFKGICSHTNFRGLNKLNEYDKFDMGDNNVFPWQKIEDGLNYQIIESYSDIKKMARFLKKYISINNKGDNHKDYHEQKYNI